uniref:Uncharacterized protein n=1 Tax=Anguilla anguilla TaxID=7936 RepID=A0A0E9TFF1_ANGAN
MLARPVHGVVVNE